MSQPDQTQELRNDQLVVDPQLLCEDIQELLAVRDRAEALLKGYEILFKQLNIKNGRITAWRHEGQTAGIKYTVRKHFPCQSGALQTENFRCTLLEIADSLRHGNRCLEFASVPRLIWAVSSYVMQGSDHDFGRVDARAVRGGRFLIGPKPNVLSGGAEATNGVRRLFFSGDCSAT